MPADSRRPVEIAFSPEFKRNLRQLAKKYRHIRADVQPIIDKLEEGEKPGDQVPRVQYEVFKVRVKNSDAKRGKSGGYRIIYYVTSEHAVVLVTIYSKTEQEDVSPSEIRRIIEQYEVATPGLSEAGDESGGDEEEDGDEAP